MRSAATYRLEDGYLSAFKVVVGLNVLAIVAVDIRQLRRHPLVPLVVVFARRGRQGGFRYRIVVVSRRRLHGRHNIHGRLHHKGRWVARRCCLSGQVRGAL